MEEAPSQWAGQQYYLTIPARAWTTPRGIGPDLFPFVPALLIKVGEGAHPRVTIATAPGTRYDADSGVIDLIPVEEAQQDPCGPTTSFELEGSDNLLSIELVRLFTLNQVAAPPLQVTSNVYGVRLENVLPEAGAPATSGTLEATLDLSQLYVLFEALGASRTPDAICYEAKAQWTPDSCMSADCAFQCEPCPGTGEPYCITVTADSLGAVPAPSLDIVEIDESSRPSSCADSTLDSGGGG
jgi:hypothetical protein